MINSLTHLFHVSKIHRHRYITAIYLFILFLSLWAPCLHSQTSLGGHYEYSFTISLANSPYKLTSSLLIDGGKCTIEPGVEIDFNGCNIVVGSDSLTAFLDADGATLNNSYGNRYILFRYGSGGTINNCTLENVYIEIDDSGAPIITNNTISDVSRGIEIDGSPEIRGNTFINADYPYEMTMMSNPVFSNNTFEEVTNVKILLDGDRIEGDYTLKRYPLDYVLYGSITTYNGVFTNDPGVVIDFNGANLIAGYDNKTGTLELDDLTVINSYGNRYILFRYGSGGTINNCALENVYIEIDDSGAPIITNNTISDVSRGIEIDGSPEIRGNTFRNTDYPYEMTMMSNPVFSNNTFEEVTNVKILLDGDRIEGDYTLKRYPLDYVLYGSITTYNGVFTNDPGVVIDFNGANLIAGYDYKTGTLELDDLTVINYYGNRYILFRYGSGGTINNCALENVYISIDDGNPVISNCTIQNVYNGIDNNSSTIISAENIYWGDPSGPYHSSNPDGKGVAVTDNVDFTPWLSSNQINIRPQASFAVTPESGILSTEFSFDASGSSDAEDPLSSLLFRWDWDNNGEWDTYYTSEYTATHRYYLPGKYLVKLEVKDSGGKTAAVNQAVTVLHETALASLSRVTNGPSIESIDIPENGTGYLYLSFISDGSPVYDEQNSEVSLYTTDTGPVDVEGRFMEEGLFRITLPSSVLGAKSSITFTFADTIITSVVKYDVSSTPVTFTANKIGTQFIRTWDIFAGGSAGISGSVGSVGVGVSVAAAKLSVKGEGGMGISISVNETGNMVLDRRMEAGISAEAKSPSINYAVGEVTVGKAELTSSTIVGERYRFTDLTYDEDKKKPPRRDSFLKRFRWEALVYLHQSVLS